MVGEGGVAAGGEWRLDDYYFARWQHNGMSPGGSGRGGGLLISPKHWRLNERRRRTHVGLVSAQRRGPDGGGTLLAEQSS